MDGRENKVVCVFMGEGEGEGEEEYYEKSELNHSLENLSDDLQNQNQEKTLFWESQEAMLQVITFCNIFFVYVYLIKLIAE